MKKKIISIMLIVAMCFSSITACGKITNTESVQMTEHEKNSNKTFEKLKAKSDYKNYISDIDKLDINGVEASITMSLVNKSKKVTDTRLDKFNSLTESYDNIKPEDINIKLAQTFKGNSGTDGLKIYCKLKDKEIGLMKTSDTLYLLNTLSDNAVKGKINISDFLNNANANQDNSIASEIQSKSTKFSDFLKGTSTYNGAYTYKKTIKDGDKIYDVLRASNETISYEMYVNQDTNLPDKLIMTSETDKDVMNVVCELTYTDDIVIDDEASYTDIDYDISKQNVNSVIGNMYLLLLLIDRTTY
jgi:predicted metal-binding transcription factor (methanogenesis marker protein 9)